MGFSFGHFGLKGCCLGTFAMELNLGHFRLLLPGNFHLEFNSFGNCTLNTVDRDLSLVNFSLETSVGRFSLGSLSF